MKWSVFVFAIAMAATLTCRRPPAATGAEEGWLTDFERAREQSRETGRPILINFTGSDWCGWCMRLSKEVFSQPEFQSYARDNLVLFKADFPRRETLPREVVDQNRALRSRYEVKGYPTIILVNGYGTVLGNTGYRPGGPEAYVEHLRELLRLAGGQ